MLTYNNPRPHLDWKRSKRNNPCLICNSIKGKCSSTSGGEMTICHYQPSNKPAGGAVPGWLHVLKPTDRDQARDPYANTTTADLRFNKPTRATNQGDQASEGPTKADALTIHQVYTDLLKLLPLSASDRRDLAADRQLTASEIEALGVKSLADYGRVVCDRLTCKYSQETLLSVPGFCRDKRGKIYLAAAAGQLLPARDHATGQIFGLRVRPYQPGDGPKYLWISSASKGGPGATSRATVYQPLSGVTEPGMVGISEGEFKSFTAAQKLGYPVICVPGVASWQSGGAVELAQSLGQQVVIFYDSEINQHTDNQRNQLADALTLAGLSVKVAIWPGEAEGGFKGIDDLLLVGGDYQNYTHVPGLGGLPITELIDQPKLNYITNNGRKALLLRSPKGTGKTHWLTGQIATTMMQGGRVLVVGHRVSLLKEASRRHSIEFYQNHKGEGKSLDGLQGLAITADSLSGLDIEGYQNTGLDLLVIDESEQFLQHLAGQTIRVRRHEVLSKLLALFALAGQVLFLDADLGSISYNFLRRAGIAASEIDLIVNQAAPATKIYINHENENDLIAAALADLKAGRRIFVVTNSRNQAKNLDRLLQSQFPKLTGWAIHSHSANTEEARDKIENINDTVLGLDWLIASPSLGTGVSIDVSHFDKVYLIGKSGVNTHKDLLQQAARVRNPKSGQVHCWVKAYQRDQATDPTRLKAQTERSAMITARSLGLADQFNRRSKNPIEAQYAALKADIQADRNASWSDLAGNFWRSVELEGHAIASALPQSQAAQKAVKVALGETRNELKQERIEGIEAAPDISKDDFEKLARRRDLTENDRHTAGRYSLQQFYGLPVEAELIEADDESRLRSKITNFLHLADPNEARAADLGQMESNWRTGQPARMLADVGNYAQKNALRLDILTAAGQVKEGKPVFAAFTAASLKAAGLADWLEVITDGDDETNRERIDRLLGIQVKTDAGLTRLVTSVLTQIGLGCDVVNHRTGETYTDPDSGKVKKARERRYTVNAGRLELMQQLARARLAVLSARAEDDDPPATVEDEADAWLMAA